MVGDFNLNLLDHRTNRKIKNYLNLTFQKTFNTSHKQTDQGD